MTVSAVARTLPTIDDGWHEFAECRGLSAQDALIFDETATEDEQQEALNEFCRSCPVRDPCYIQARTNDATSGVYGGHVWQVRTSWIKGAQRSKQCADEKCHWCKPRRKAKK